MMRGEVRGRGGGVEGVETFGYSAGCRTPTHKMRVLPTEIFWRLRRAGFWATGCDPVSLTEGGQGCPRSYGGPRFGCDALSWLVSWVLTLRAEN